MNERELFLDGVEEPLTKRERDSYWNGTWTAPEPTDEDGDE